MGVACGEAGLASVSCGRASRWPAEDGRRAGSRRASRDLGERSDTHVVRPGEHGSRGERLASVGRSVTTNPEWPETPTRQRDRRRGACSRRHTRDTAATSDRSTPHSGRDPESLVGLRDRALPAGSSRQWHVARKVGFPERPRPERRLPALVLLPGATPAHDPRCRASRKAPRSVPISTRIVQALHLLVIAPAARIGTYRGSQRVRTRVPRAAPCSVPPAHDPPDRPARGRSCPPDRVSAQTGRVSPYAGLLSKGVDRRRETSGCRLKRGVRRRPAPRGCPAAGLGHLHGEAPRAVQERRAHGQHPMASAPGRRTARTVRQFQSGHVPVGLTRPATGRARFAAWRGRR